MDAADGADTLLGQGTRVGDFQIHSFLGEGAMGQVYLAQDITLGRRVALKFIKRSVMQSGGVDRFLEEARATASFSHPHIVTLHAVGEHEGRPYLALEYVDGASLRACLAAGPLPMREALHYCRAVAEAIAEAHQRGLVHADLKPENILIPRDGRVRVVDFGVAKLVGGAPNAASGTPAYMAPERWRGAPPTGAIDIWALGVMLHELITGRRPIADAELPYLPFAANTLDLLDLPEAPWAQLVRDCLALDPAARPTADELVRRFARLLEPYATSNDAAAEELRIPQKLYGRDAESAALCEAFERVAESGTPELVLVSGYAGIGKSSVVRELLGPIVRRRGRFIAGKFEQYKRDIPYFTISQALRALALDLLAEGESGIARWRQRLVQALGPSGKLVVDLVPQLEQIVGPQPPVPELPLTDAETRLRLVFGRLFAACAAAEHPLTMFIDDMQWADTASLQLVANLMTDGETRHLLIVGAYRDNEVDPSHPMVRAFEPVRRSGVRIRDIVLEPLSEENIGRLVADTVHASPAEAAPLASLVRHKTGGNPFFAIQFLTALYHKRSIWFDREAYRWRWDVGRDRAEVHTDGVAELMRDRLSELPGETQALLQLAACLGGAVDATTLAIACECTVAPALQPAVDQHLLLESVRAGRRTYRFPHDWVHEAAYALLPEPERARLHLEIGRRLLASTPPEELAERVFEIVNQLDRGAALIESGEERERLAELHLAAGARAQASTAYASALRYFTTGAAMLGADAWKCCPELAFALEIRRAECELLTGALDVAEPRLAELARRAGSLVDLAAVTSARLALYTTRDRSDLAVESGLEYLRRAGIEWSAHPTADEVRREYDRIWQQLGARAIEDLVDLPPMLDPDLRATLDVLTLALPSALFADDNLYLLTVCRAVNLSLQHGNSDASCMAYITLAALLRPRFGEHAAGFRFGQLGFDLVERRKLLRWRPRVYLEFSYRILPWTKHVRDGVELARRAFEAAKEVGDLTFASYACNSATTLSMAAGAPLAEMERETERALAFLHKVKLEMMIDVVTTQLQLIHSLRGRTRELGSFTDETFDEQPFTQRLDRHPHLGTAWYWIHKVQALFLAGDHAGAVAAAARARPLLSMMPSFPETGEYVFYTALACAAHHDAAPEADRPRLAEELAAHHAQLAAWAEHCPDNFSARAALAGAELARLRDDAAAALQGYELAIRATREHGFVHYEAIAYEAAARFYRARGQALIADAYVREAHARYARWGADAKARQLRAAYPELGL